MKRLYIVLDVPHRQVVLTIPKMLCNFSNTSLRFPGEIKINKV